MTITKFFVINKDFDLIREIASLSIYRNWLNMANCFIVVLLNKENSYHYTKDVQAIGAAIQNILLAAHDMGISSCWIGEVLKNENRIKDLLGIQSKNLELMAIIALGYGIDSNVSYIRKDLQGVLLGWK